MDWSDQVEKGVADVKASKKYYKERVHISRNFEFLGLPHNCKSCKDAAIFDPFTPPVLYMGISHAMEDGKKTTPVHDLFLYVLSSILWQLLDSHTDDKEIGFLYCV